MNKRKTGAKYEKQAADYLERQGVEILARNYRNRKGEIDLIGRDSEYTVFFEVKYRRDNSKGTPEEAVHYGKQKKYMYGCRLLQNDSSDGRICTNPL